MKVWSAKIISMHLNFHISAHKKSGSWWNFMSEKLALFESRKASFCNTQHICHTLFLFLCFVSSTPTNYESQAPFYGYMCATKATFQKSTCSLGLKLEQNCVIFAWFPGFCSTKLLGTFASILFLAILQLPYFGLYMHANV